MDEQKESWLIVTGNPVSGFEFIGPFDEHDDAISSATSKSIGDWWIALIEKP